jgi:organic radical activating enzyme
MDCRILRALTLKSNGQLVCDDSSGYGIILGDLSSAPSWNIRQVIDGPVYGHVRRSFAEGRAPWPGTCEGCHTFSAGGVAADTLNSRISIIVEPTLACNLQCPSCMRVREGKTRAGAWDLDSEKFEALLRSCAKNDIEIEVMHYLGWGEPLLYEGLGTLTRLVRKWHPDCIQEVTTSGSIADPTVLDNAGIDRLTVSCDGARQESYVKYRRAGDVAQVFRLFDHASRLTDKPYVEWKYILFDHNDSDAELALVQQLAEQFAVDSLLFIITNSKRASKRYTVSNIRDFPLPFSRAHISPAAALLTIRQTGRLVPEYSTLGDREEFSLFLDQAQITDSNILELRGWSLRADGGYVDRIECYSGPDLLGWALLNERRRDVVKHRPAVQGPDCGFAFKIPVDAGFVPQSLHFRVSSGANSGQFSATLQFTGAQE